MLRVVARRSFGLLHVVPAVPSFRAAFPKVSLDLTLTEATGLTPVNGIDVVIRLGLPAEKSFVGKRLASACRVLCASPSCVERSPPLCGPDDLARHDCLCYRREYEPAIWIFENDRGKREIEVSGPLVSNSGEVLRRTAIEGLGLALLPEWMGGHDLASGRLVAPLAARRAYLAGYQAEVYAIYMRAESVPAKIAAFVAHLCGWLGVTFAV